MTNTFDAAHEIADNAIEQLQYLDKVGQISHVFVMTEFVSEQISEYCNNSLSMTHDIVSLWQSLGWPEPEQMSGSISESMLDAIRGAISQHGGITDHIASAIRLWASDEIIRREIKDIDADSDDTEELIRALA